MSSLIQHGNDILSVVHDNLKTYTICTVSVMNKFYRVSLGFVLYTIQADQPWRFLKSMWISGFFTFSFPSFHNAGFPIYVWHMYPPKVCLYLKNVSQVLFVLK